MADVVLKNNTKHPKRMLVFNLTRDLAPVKVTNRTTEESKDGLRRVRVSSKLVPDSIRIPHGATSGPLPEACLQVPEIAKAIEARELIVVAAPVDTGLKPAKAPPAASPQEDAPTKGTERKRRR